MRICRCFSLCMLTIKFSWLVSVSNLYGQDQRIADSLIHELQTRTFSDSLKTQILIKVSFNQNDPDKALHYAEQVIKHGEIDNQEPILFKGYQLKGTALRLIGDLDSSIKAYLSAFDFAVTERQKSEIYSNLGEVYSDMGNSKSAILYYIKAYRQIQNLDETILLAGILTNLGYEYYKSEENDSSLVCFNRALGIFEYIGYEIGFLYCLGNMGLVYAKMGDYPQAEKNMQSAVLGLRKYEDYYAITDFETEIAEIYRLKGDLLNAQKYAAISLEMSDSLGLKIQARDASYELYKIHLDAHEFELAVSYLNKYYALRDSVTNAENIQRIADLRTEFEVGQKQAEVDLLTAEKEIENIIRIGLVMGLGTLVVFIMVLSYHNRQKQIINNELKVQKSKLEELNHTKDKFFSIISHDLRGPINSFFGISRMIKSLVNKRKTDELLEVADDIDHSVDRLSALLDNLLAWALQQQGHFPNVPEKVHLNDLVDDLVKTLETMSKGKDITLFAKIEGPIDLWVDRNSTMTILRNLVNNALKFTPEGGQVTIKAHQNGWYANIQVSDTGVGIPKSKLNSLFRLLHKKSTYGTSGEKGLGLGLQLVNEFVEMNQGAIKLESEEGQGTTFMIELPLFTAIKETKTQRIN